MISESIIEKAVANLTEHREETESIFINNHRIFFDYLHEEIYSALDEELQSQLYFCIVVLHESFRISNGTLPTFSIEEYAEYEDENWGISDDQSSWEATVNTFFEEYKEEDLLAFIEDMLSEADENANSSASIEVMFIVAKSYIDTICGV